MPLVLHYSGHRADAPGRQPPRLPRALLPEVSLTIAQLLEDLQPTMAFGALASGADILVAEQLLASRVPLHVVLPLPPPWFIPLSVENAEDDWVPRFQACWQAASSQRVTRVSEPGTDAEIIALGSQVAMGLTLLAAGSTKGAAAQMAIWDGQDAEGPAGTAADIAVWQATGAPTHLVLLSSGAPTCVAGLSWQQRVDARRRKLWLANNDRPDDQAALAALAAAITQAPPLAAHTRP